MVEELTAQHKSMNFSLGFFSGASEAFSKSGWLKLEENLHKVQM